MAWKPIKPKFRQITTKKDRIESQRESVKIIKHDLKSPFVRVRPKAKKEGMAELRREQAKLNRLLKPKRKRKRISRRKKRRPKGIKKRGFRLW